MKPRVLRRPVGGWHARVWRREVRGWLWLALIFLLCWGSGNVILALIALMTPR